MRFYEILNEKRKNPHVNPKTNVYYTIKKRYDETDDYIDKDTRNLFANFIGLDKLGTNPRSFYRTTPQGVYAYPVRWILDKLHSGASMKELYAGGSEFVNLFNIDNNANILHIATADREQKYLDMIAEIYSDETGKSYDETQMLINKLLEQYPIFSGGYVYKSLYGDVKILAEHLFRNVWKTKNPVRMTKLLRKLGFDGVYDRGFGEIHQGQPAQLVIFNIKMIKNNQRFLNKDYRNRSDYGQSYHELMTTFRKLLKTGDYEKIIDFLNKYQERDFYKLLRPIKDPILRQEIIKNFMYAIHGLKNPTKEEQLLALQYHFKYLINNEGLTIPDKSLLSYAIELFDIEDDVVKFIEEKYLTDNDKIALVKKNPELIFKLKNPNEQLTELAIQLGTDKKLTRLYMLNITEEELKNNIEMYKSTVNYYTKRIPENRQHITQYQKEYKELIDYIKTLPANDQMIPIIKNTADEKKKSIESFQNYLDTISDQILYNKTQLMKMLRIQKFINK